MKEKNLQYLIYFVCAVLMIGCTKEVDKIVVPIHRASENIHTVTEDLDMPAIEGIPDTEFHVKNGKIALEKKF
jgi:hypothetical protein